MSGNTQADFTSNGIVILRTNCTMGAHANKENTMQTVIQNSLLCTIVSVCLLAHADPVCQKKSGETICGKGEIETMGANGIFRAEQTKFKKRLVIRGQAMIKDCDINDVKIYGQAVMTGSQVQGKSEIYGHLEAISTQFKQPLVAHTNELRARGSTFTGMIITPAQSGCHVELQENSCVSGDVVFRGQPGTVVLSGGSRITGKIINGKQQ